MLKHTQMDKEFYFPEEWLLHNFDDLDEVQQQQVLQEMRVDEFKELQEAHSFLLNSFQLPHQEPLAIPNFQPKQKGKLKLVLSPFWQAAAVLLLVGISFLAGRQLQISMQPKELSLHDTVYLQAGLPDTIYQFDTVFLIKERWMIAKHKSLSRIEFLNTEFNPGDSQLFGRNPLDELEHLKNKSKNLDFRDDSLLRNFSFVRI